MKDETVSFDEILKDPYYQSEFDKKVAKSIETATARLTKELEDAKATIKKRDSQLEELKNSSGDLETLKQKVADLQTANKEASEKYEAELKQIKLDNAIENAITNSKAKNSKAVRALLDLASAELDEKGAVKGLDKQLEALMQSDAYLFNAETQTITSGLKPGEQTQTKPNVQKKESEMSYDDFLAQYTTK